MSWANEGMMEIGYVVSEGTPLMQATGLPLDFIAICHLKNGLFFKPVSYSIPLGMKFTYRGKENASADEDALYWRIEEMVNEDLYDALDDEALEVSLTTY